MSRARVLWALASTDNFTGTAARVELDLARRLSASVELEIAIDDLARPGVDALRGFCEQHGITLHVGHGEWSARAPDPMNHDLPALLASGDWDAIECHGWSNASTNAAVAAGAGAATVIYTPHDPPVRSLRLSPAQRGGVEAAHRALLARADAVRCDSAEQRRRFSSTVPAARCVDAPPGLDFEPLAPGPDVREGFVFIAAEPGGRGARFERLAAALAAARRQLPGLRLVSADRDGDHVPDPHLLQSSEWLGAVGERELRRHYARASATIFPYAHEAAGLAVLEALGCGTPVVIDEGPDLRSRYGDLRSVVFVDLADAKTAGERLARTIISRTQIAALADRDRLRSAHCAEVAAERHAQLLGELIARRRGPR